MIEYEVGHSEIKTRMTKDGSCKTVGLLLEIKKDPADKECPGYPKHCRNRFKYPAGARIQNPKMSEMSECESRAVYYGSFPLAVLLLKTPMYESPVHKLFSYGTKNHTYKGVYAEINKSFFFKSRGQCARI